MGRPLNKKFFGDPADAGYQVACNAYVSASSKASYIIEQKSNTKYRVTDVATETDTGICKLVDATPSAIGEMQVVVTPDNAQTPAEATFTVNRTAGGAIDNTATVITSGGYGYWTDGTFNIGVDTDGGYVAGTEAVITYTVANGSIDTANVTTPGVGYTASADAALAVNTADITDEAATPPAENARIINARTVKTFEGNTYAWPIVAPLGGRPGRGSTSFTEADIGA